MNPVTRFFQWFIDFLNGLIPDRSGMALVREQESSYANALTDSYESLKNSGGNIGKLMRTISRRQAELKTSEAELRQVIVDSQGLTGTAHESAQRRIASLTRIVTMRRGLVQRLQTSLTGSKENQEMAEFGWQELDATRDLANAEARASLDEQVLYELLEDIADAQLAASGKIKGAKIKDHRGELADRAAMARGRAETAQRMASAALGRPKSTVALTDDEANVLAEAYAAAGVDMPGQEAAAEETATS